MLNVQGCFANCKLHGVLPVGRRTSPRSPPKEGRTRVNSILPLVTRFSFPFGEGRDGVLPAKQLWHYPLQIANCPLQTANSSIGSFHFLKSTTMKAHIFKSCWAMGLLFIGCAGFGITLAAQTSTNLTLHQPLAAATPAGAVLEWHSALPATAGNMLTAGQVASAGTGVYYALYHFTVSGCYGKARAIRVIDNVCPATTVNIRNAVDSAAKPAGTVVSWHTGTPATVGNRLTVAQVAAAPAGTYFTAYYDASSGCFSATAPIVVLFKSCTVTMPPVAQNSSNAPINSSAAQTPVSPLMASDPQGAGVTGFTITTMPPVTEGTLYTCSNNTVPCSGSFMAVTTGQVLTPAQAQALYFDPAANFTGTTGFSFTATGPSGTGNTAHVSIPVVNNAPTASSFTTGAAAQNSGNVQVPALSAADADGTITTYSITPPAAAQGVLSYGGTPMSGVTNVSPAQSATLHFTPATGFTGDAAIAFTAMDNNNNNSTPATVTIPVTVNGAMPSNLSPVTQNVTATPVNSNAGSTPVSPLSGTDPDGAIVSFTIGTVPAPAIGILYACSNGTFPCSGTLTAISAGQSISPAQAATLQFDPADGNNSPAVFTYKATDNGGTQSNTGTITIPVYNNPPAAMTMLQPVSSNTTNARVAPPVANDADGTIAGFTLTAVPDAATEGSLYTCSNNTVPCTGSYTAITAGTALTPAQAAALTFSPVAGYEGTATAAYTATDNNGKVSNAAAMMLSVTGTIPVGASPVATGSNPTIGANAGITPLGSTFMSATDADGSIASFNILSVPSASQGVYTYCSAPPSGGCGTPLTTGTISAAQAATLSFEPDVTYHGAATLTFNATDNDGNVSNMSGATINVSSDAPAASGYTTTAVSSGGSGISTPLSATDPDNGTVVAYTVTSTPPAGNGKLSYCLSPSDCATPVTEGLILTPDQAASMVYTPDADMKMFVAPYTFTATDNSGNLSNVATITIPIMNATPLPLHLLSFTATAGSNCTVGLQWTTANELDIAHYAVEYSADGRSFNTVYTVKSNNTVAGNTYNYQYGNASNGNALFRLRMEESNGRYSYSPTQKITLNCTGQGYSVSPNPAEGLVYIQGGTATTLQVSLINVLGQTIKTVQLNGSNRAIDLSSLAAGTYIIRAEEGSKVVLNSKVVKL